MTRSSPTQKNVLLLGAGNAHLSFVRRFGLRPPTGMAVTLVCDFPVVPYSGMVGGHIGGEYSREEVSIDLVRLCHAHGVSFVGERATEIDLPTRSIQFATRPPLKFDVASLGVGSRPALPPGLADGPSSWLMRPLGTTLDRLDALEAELKATPRAFHLVVAGGGASGCELALAIRKRFAAAPGFRVSLIQGNSRLVPTLPARAARILERALGEREIAVRLGARITGGDATTLVLDETERVDCDAVLWATHAGPPELVKTSGLPLDPGGFLAVKDTLQSTGDPAVFGTGDCVSFVSRPGLPKNGVYAVREGGLLFENVVRFLSAQPLEPFVPQRFFRNILNLSDGRALYTYGPLAWKSRAARRLKDRIDRAWMAKFRSLSPTPGGERTGAAAR